MNPSRPTLLLLLVNARVRALDPARPGADAVAVAGDRSVREAAELRAMAGPGTRSIDCQGKPLLPGFHDSHMHLLGHASH